MLLQPLACAFLSFGLDNRMQLIPTTVEYDESEISSAGNMAPLPYLYVYMQGPRVDQARAILPGRKHH